MLSKHAQLEYLLRSKIAYNLKVNISHWPALKHLHHSLRNTFDWHWDKRSNMDAILDDTGTIVVFHPEFSSGTEIVVGNKPLDSGCIHFWEIELLNPVYGTDMMIGFINDKFFLPQYQFVFRSALGEDDNSWGVSYHGYFQHNSVKTRLLNIYSPLRFGDGTKIALELDTWHGQCNVYINGTYHATLWNSEKFTNSVLYPAISSTAARTKMRLTTALTKPLTLQYITCKELAKIYKIEDLIIMSKKYKFLYMLLVEYYWLFY